MRVLLTGGSGDLGRLLISQLTDRDDVAVNFDVSRPAERMGEFVEGSILDRGLLESTLPNIDCVVHIAAWHGIHEFRKQRDAFDFWELNVNGTFTLLECCARAGLTKFVFISSSSIDDWPGIYAHSKIVGEDLMRTYAARHSMKIISLRPRAFIPHWNRAVYATFPEWARWYWRGAVHISDVAQAVTKAIETVMAGTAKGNLILDIDGACDFSKEELDNWDADGPGTTFKQHFGQERYALAVASGLDPSSKPHIIGSVDAERAIGYKPTYGFEQMLAELQEHAG